MDKSLSDSLLQKFIKQESCDVFFLVEERKIGAHKLVLEIQCQVLYEMAKDWTPDKQPFPLETVSYKHFEEFLRYLSYNLIFISKLSMGHFQKI